MRRLEARSPLSRAAHDKRLHGLAAAFAAFRRASTPGRRIPRGLQVQVVAAVRAGVSRSSIERACRVSWTQVNRWLAAIPGVPPMSSPMRAPAALEPRVLAVVDAPEPAPQTPDVEVRIGPWLLRLSRAAG